jgi:hypothetical protein
MSEKARFVKRFAYAANTRQLEHLPRDHWNKFLILDADLVLTKPTSGTSHPENSPFTLLDKIKLMGQGLALGAERVTFLELTGEQLFILNSYEIGRSPYYEEPTIGVAAADNVDFQLIIPHQMFAPSIHAGASKGELLKTGIDTRGLSTYDLELQYAANTVLINGGGVTSLTGGFNIYEVGDEAAPPKYMKKYYRRDMVIPKTINAASTRFPILISDGGTLVKSLIIRATKDGVQSDALVNFVTLKAGGVAHIDHVEWDVLQKNNMTFNPLIPHAAGGVNDLARGAADSAVRAGTIAGCLYIETDREGDIPEGLLDSSDLGAVELELDVNAPSGVTNVEVIVTELIPIMTRPGTM